MRPLLPMGGPDRRSAGVQSVEPHRASAWIPIAGICENGSQQLADDEHPRGKRGDDGHGAEYVIAVDGQVPGGSAGV